jgi:hypothetical protein
MFPLFKESFSKASSGLGKSLFLLTCDFGRSLLASQHKIAIMRNSLRRRKMRQIMLKHVSNGDMVIQSQLFDIPISQHHFVSSSKKHQMQVNTTPEGVHTWQDSPDKT